jgi:phosphoserine phosphatase
VQARIDCGQERAASHTGDIVETMTALHVFDMDGTLLRGTTAPIEISRRIGRLEPLAELERGFATEEITATEFAVEMRALWQDLTAELVAEIVADAPWIDGIEDVCHDIAQRGERSMLITMSPSFFAQHLGDRGIDIVRASQFPPLPFAAPIDPTGILNPADKVRLAEAERAAHGLPRSACVAYGDSMSDIPLFAVLQNTVAVNADAALESAARVAYRGQDLREAYAHGRALLDVAASEDPGAAP